MVLTCMHSTFVTFSWQASQTLFLIDVDTRRRAASDLVRALCKFHEQRVIEIFSLYVGTMLQVCVC